VVVVYSSPAMVAVLARDWVGVVASHLYLSVAVAGMRLALAMEVEQVGEMEAVVASETTLHCV